jgi:uncharacterized membrane protein YbhN (UPF0104 family)
MINRSWKWWLQLLVTVLVITFVAIAFWRPLEQLHERQVSWSSPWLVLAGIAYAIGLCCSLAFWWLALTGLGQHPNPHRVPWAYFLGHLAKYVPGKALVVLLRTVIVRGPQCRTEVAAVSVIYDTILFMAVGAIFAGLIVLIGGPLGEHLRYWHVLLLIGALVPLAFPPVFNGIMQRLTAPLRRLPDGTHAPFPRLSLRLLLIGLGLQTCGVVLLGASLAATIKSVRPDVEVIPMLPELVAKLAAATVLGFVIPTPAGLGTREYALMLMLQDDLGPDFAALVPLITRLTWLVTECLIVAVLIPFRHSTGPSDLRSAER